MTRDATSLERLSALRQRERDAAAGHLARAHRAAQTAQAQLNELQRYAADYGAQPMAASVWQLQTRRAFAERLSHAQSQQAQRIQRAEHQALQAQAQFQKAQLANRSIHRAAESQRQQLNHERDRRQQRLEDDLGVNGSPAWAVGG